MDKLNYTALRETICHSVLSNGLNIYVDERPEYGKQFAFFRHPLRRDGFAFSRGGRQLDRHASRGGPFPGA